MVTEFRTFFLFAVRLQGDRSFILSFRIAELFVIEARSPSPPGFRVFVGVSMTCSGSAGRCCASSSCSSSRTVRALRFRQLAALAHAAHFGSFLARATASMGRLAPRLGPCAPAEASVADRSSNDSVETIHSVVLCCTEMRTPLTFDKRAVANVPLLYGK